ncbi:hypothetical protein ACLBWT_03500, partial [Paenibacillus sp. D51F]
KKQEARSKKQEARSKKQEARSKKQEARSKKQETRSKKQEVRSPFARAKGLLWLCSFFPLLAERRMGNAGIQNQSI